MVSHKWQQSQKQNPQKNNELPQRKLYVIAFKTHLAVTAFDLFCRSWQWGYVID